MIMCCHDSMDDVEELLRFLESPQRIRTRHQRITDTGRYRMTIVSYNVYIIGLYADGDIRASI